MENQEYQEKEPAHKCDECGKETTDIHVCSRCKSSDYCSRKCQQKAWKKGHKYVCVDYRLLVGEDEEEEKDESTADKRKYDVDIEKVKDEMLKSNKYVSFGAPCVDRSIAKSKIRRFMIWAQNRGLEIKKKFQIQKIPGKGYGLVADEKIRSGEVIFKIEKSKCLNRFIMPLVDVDRCVGGEDEIAVGFKKLAKEVKLDHLWRAMKIAEKLMLIYHRFILKEKSEFWPYLDVLPTTQDALNYPAVYPYENLLKGSAIATTIDRMKKECLASFAVMKEVNKIEGVEITMEMVIWANVILYSRCWNYGYVWMMMGESIFKKGLIEMQFGKVLIPMVDFINSGDVSHELVSTYADEEKENLIQKAVGEIRAGEEICHGHAYRAVNAEFAQRGYIENKYKPGWYFAPLKKDNAIQFGRQKEHVEEKEYFFYWVENDTETFLKNKKYRKECNKFVMKFSEGVTKKEVELAMKKKGKEVIDESLFEQLIFVPLEQKRKNEGGSFGSKRYIRVSEEIAHMWIVQKIAKNICLYHPGRNERSIRKLRESKVPKWMIDYLILEYALIERGIRGYPLLKSPRGMNLFSKWFWDEKEKIEIRERIEDAKMSLQEICVELSNWILAYELMESVGKNKFQRIFVFIYRSVESCWLVKDRKRDKRWEDEKLLLGEIAKDMEKEVEFS